METYGLNMDPDVWFSIFRSKMKNLSRNKASKDAKSVKTQSDHFRAELVPPEPARQEQTQHPLLQITAFVIQEHGV